VKKVAEKLCAVQDHLDKKLTPHQLVDAGTSKYAQVACELSAEGVQK